jgi:putative tryptophan/tyrosine transport system substrate-binding protein
MTTHIGRRELLAALSGAAAAWPLGARAQQPTKVPRVGILSPAASETATPLAAFREGLRDLGYIEGQTIVLDFRLSKGIVDSYRHSPRGAVALCVGIRCGAISSDMKLSSQAARSIG